MSRWFTWLVSIAILVWAAPSAASLEGRALTDIADAITELDVGRARELLSKLGGDSSVVAVERARLSLYLGDCDTASATLGTVSGVKEAPLLSEVARTCAHSTAGSVIVEKADQGLWFRLQDGEDRVLIPLLSDIAVRARAAIEHDLGVVLPRPLRIDLVRDLFSLSSVSGLPLKAAETTGTVAVARWGRVTMISPRAAPKGFPWEDTLAHEITHLAVTRATRDEAPLWLQEGLAKRQETRWRPKHVFDGEPAPDVVARNALLSGESVGIDRLGPSIAMLPSADAATIAFAEVSSFIDYFVQEMGVPALRALFMDLKVLGSDEASRALQGVSGYDLSEWVVRWRAHLLADAQHAEPSDAAPSAALTTAQRLSARDVARRSRIAELLVARGAAPTAIARLEPALDADKNDAELRFRVGKSLIAAGRVSDAAPLFRSATDLDAPNAGWFAFAGRFAPDPAAAQGAFDLALSFDPYLEEAACKGDFRMFGVAADPGPEPGRAAAQAWERALCESARNIPVD